MLLAASDGLDAPAIRVMTAMSVLSVFIVMLSSCALSEGVPGVRLFMSTKEYPQISDSYAKTSRYYNNNIMLSAFRGRLRLASGEAAVAPILARYTLYEPSACGRSPRPKV